VTASNDREQFDKVVAEALRAHDVDPDGSDPVPLEKMESIARYVRVTFGPLRGLSRTRSPYEWLDWIVPRILDRSTSEEGLQASIAALARGLGLDVTFPRREG
jgi:hypothetical protein